MLATSAVPRHTRFAGPGKAAPGPEPRPRGAVAFPPEACYPVRSTSGAAGGPRSERFGTDAMTADPGTVPRRGQGAKAADPAAGSGRAAGDWPRTVFDRLVDAGVSLFAYVPDAGNARIVRLAEEHDATRAVLLSNEQEGVALCAGADLVGGRAVLLMQSSGVGNCPNMLSLSKAGNFPLLMIVTMRGDHGERNPWQYPMGEATAPVLAAMGVRIVRVERESDVAGAVDAALAEAFAAGQRVALVLSQKLLGAKDFGPATA